MRLNEINLTQRTLITEGWNDPRLTLLETQHIIPFITSVERYIVEAKLNPQQISQLFTDVEAGATAAGGNRNALGKGTDAAKFISAKMKEIGQAVKKSGPVENADAKFAELKAKIGAKDGKVVQAIQGVSDWAKENPGKATIAVTILTAAAGMAAGPMAGAIGGFIMRASKDLLQGNDLSTAAGNALKTAAIGALVGGLSDVFKSSDLVDITSPATEGGVAGITAELSTDDITSAAEIADPADLIDVMPDLAETKLQFAQDIAENHANSGMAELAPEMVQKMADSMIESGDYPQNFNITIPDGAEFVRGNVYLTPDEAAAFEKAGFQGFKVMSAEASEWIEANVEGGDAWAADNAELSAEYAAADARIAAEYDAMSPEDQQAYDAEKSQSPIFTSGFDEYTPPGTPKYKESISFNALQLETIIEWCDLTPAVILTEGPLDAIKKSAAAAGGAIKKGAAAAGQAAGGAIKKGAAAVGAKAAKVGKNITTKVTADKLNSAWKKAGSPTDSDAVANILRQQGVDDKVLAPVYKTLGAKLPAAPVAAPAAPGAKPGPGGKPAAPVAAPAAPGAKPGPGGKPAAAGQTAAPGAKPAAAATMDFKGIQQAVAKLTPVDAKALVTHIDSLGSKPAAAPGAKPAVAAPNTAAQPAQANAAPSAQPAAQDATAAPTAPGQAPTAKPAAAPNKNAAAGDTFEKAKGDIRKVQGGQKPMPPKISATIDGALAKLAKGDKESGVFAAQKIMNVAKLGVDVSKQQQAWIGNAKAGEKFLTQSVYFEISKMLKEHNLSWSDLGMRVHLLEGTNKMFGISLI